MKTWIYVVRPPRATFPADATPAEIEILGRHADYFATALASEQLVLAGPCEDAAFGIAIFRAADEAAARDFMNNDPAVKENVFSAELRPFRLSFYEGN